MGRVAGIEDEVLVSVSFLVVQICRNIAVFFNNQNIQKWKFIFIDIHCELNVDRGFTDENIFFSKTNMKI
jgi:hypothetical protein